MQGEFWSVAVDAPLAQSLTYAASSSLTGTLSRGQLVEVPLGKRKAKGVLLGKTSKPENFSIKDISSVDSEYSPLPDFFLKWIEWVAHYYIYPVGSVAALAYPPLSRNTRGRKSHRPNVVPTLPEQKPMNLTPEQDSVLKSIQSDTGFKAHLLFGVTGSGKTEVYLSLLKKVVASGKRGLILVPEIALTPQLINRFASRFGDQIAVLHSQLTDRERTTQWWDMVEGRKSILIGARSALFCPIENLGLVIVDEEHEPSYKQEEKLKYHGRDSAVMLAKFADCPVVLGSATPSLESWKNALDGKYGLHRMPSRVENRSLPSVEIVDMRGQNNWLSPELSAAMNVANERKDQIALFLNRRGIAPVVLCPDCGYSYECPNCDISLTLHGRSHLVCHYCDYHEDMKLDCPSCKEGEMKPVGLGTEMIQNEIQNLFPQAVVARADRDEIQNRLEMEELVNKMETGEIDILVGTQMIAKGLDFPKLNLVGLVLADVGFNLPDFRATERSFQLITQVAGRAGRHVKPGDPPGRVLLQTYNPDHPSLKYAQTGDFQSFAKEELAEREVLSYPPFGKLVSFRIQGLHNSRVQDAAKILQKRCQQLREQDPSLAEIEILGPAPAPILKVRNQFRYHLLLKGKNSRDTLRFCYKVLGDESWLPAGVRLLVDVDPISLL